MPYNIRIENFEGPLDLLLHLIKKNEMDIHDIPVAEITVQYQAMLDAMRSLDLDVAGEFLVMAATLVHIKSRLLLPPSEEPEADEDEADPRAELVRRLLEYQKYKEAAADLETTPMLGREVFARTWPAPELEEPEAGEFHAVGLYELVEAIRALMQQSPEPSFHEVYLEQLSVTERINGILDLLGERKQLRFSDLFPQSPGRNEVVVTFLAMLELVKLRLVIIMQTARIGPIMLFPAVAVDDASFLDLNEEALGYG